jgi:hypothetical protein
MIGIVPQFLDQQPSKHETLCSKSQYFQEKGERIFYIVSIQLWDALFHLVLLSLSNIENRQKMASRKHSKESMLPSSQ